MPYPYAHSNPTSAKILALAQLLCGELTRPLFLNGGVACETRPCLKALGCSVSSVVVCSRRGRGGGGGGRPWQILLNHAMLQFL